MCLDLKAICADHPDIDYLADDLVVVGDHALTDVSDHAHETTAADSLQITVGEQSVGVIVVVNDQVMVPAIHFVAVMFVTCVMFVVCDDPAGDECDGVGDKLSCT